MTILALQIFYTFSIISFGCAIVLNKFTSLVATQVGAYCMVPSSVLGITIKKYLLIWKAKTFVLITISHEDQKLFSEAGEELSSCFASDFLNVSSIPASSSGKNKTAHLSGLLWGLPETGVVPQAPCLTHSQFSKLTSNLHYYYPDY